MQEIFNSKDLKLGKDLINSSLFNTFLRLNVDRCEVISQFLKLNDVPYSVVNLKGRKHIIVKYCDRCYSDRLENKTIVAHYDRCPNIESANDNSAACLQLMAFAVDLLKIRRPHNIKIIFTDGEEAGSDGLSKQGSFLLGAALRKLNMHKSEHVYVFDLCGVGDCLIISQSGIFKRGSKVPPGLIAFHRQCCEIAKNANIKYLSLPTAYSDNAGLIATGINAQVITVLPMDEAMKLKDAITVANPDPELVNLIITNSKPEPNSKLADILPKTWQAMHTLDDTRDKLTPSSFNIVKKFLHALTTENNY